jgi:hypothetical protein
MILDKKLGYNDCCHSKRNHPSFEDDNKNANPWRMASNDAHPLWTVSNDVHPLWTASNDAHPCGWNTTMPKSSRPCKHGLSTLGTAVLIGDLEIAPRFCKPGLSNHIAPRPSKPGLSDNKTKLNYPSLEDSNKKCQSFQDGKQRCSSLMDDMQ